jgi:hypothetical protein
VAGTALRKQTLATKRLSTQYSRRDEKTKPRFNKRFTRLPESVAAREILDHLDDLLTARRRGRISRAFAEKIMLAFTQVNDYRYCRYGHLHMALQAGVSELEIHILKVTSERSPRKNRSPGLAQHYDRRSS